MVYELGPDEFGNEPADAVWTVTHYTYEYWEGWGEMVSLLPGGILEIRNLSHCSCNDPMDNDGDCVSVEKYLEDRGSVVSYISNEHVDSKVFELLSGGVE